MRKSIYKFKSKYQENLFKKYLAEEPNCSFNGREILITGNTKRLNKQGFALSKPITVEEFLFVKHKKKAWDLRLDHANDYEPTTDKKGKTWKISIACRMYNNEGEEIHPFLQTLLKEFSTKTI